MAGQESISSTFVDSLRVLFNILADKQGGVVKFSDIEGRWGRGDCPGLPKGILDCLRNLTSSSGELTFDRFCAGLKICLLKNDNATSSSNTSQPPPKPPRQSTLFVVEQEPSSSSKRREPRRHTLQNGIDYNRLKRLKQLEQEKNMLKETLSTVTETQNWLNQKLHAVHDQIRHVGRSTAPLESSTNHHQERLDMKRAQTAEVVRNLVRLVNNWSSIDKNNFMFELNLETQWSSHERLQRLKQDNHQLLQELSEKREMVARLEHQMRQMKRY